MQHTPHTHLFSPLFSILCYSTLNTQLSSLTWQKNPQDLATYSCPIFQTDNNCRRFSNYLKTFLTLDQLSMSTLVATPLSTDFLEPFSLCSNVTSDFSHVFVLLILLFAAFRTFYFFASCLDYTFIPRTPSIILFYTKLLSTKNLRARKMPLKRGILYERNFLAKRAHLLEEGALPRRVHNLKEKSRPKRAHLLEGGALGRGGRTPSKAHYLKKNALPKRAHLQKRSVL